MAKKAKPLNEKIARALYAAKAAGAGSYTGIHSVRVGILT